jgi:toxin-antitoxin system PIN domain toxin
VIAVDTNILVHAHRSGDERHARASAALDELVEGQTSWAVAWPCFHEFLTVVTHPRVYDPPSTMAVALQAVAAIRSVPTMVTISEGPDHAAVLTRLLLASRAVGPKVHDAKIAAICLSHGVTELWTADRDFSYFPELRTRNPLVG